MKPEKYRELTREELERILRDLREELFNLRFQQEVGQLENPSKMKQTKRDIARIRTVLNEMALSAKETDN